MKTRIALLLLAAAVLLSAHAGALPASSPSSGTAAPFCFTQSASPTFPNWASNGMAPVLSLPNCGVCSTGCSGAKLGTQCGVGPGGRIEFCQNQGTNCSQDGLPNCLCTYMPIQ